MFIIVPTALFGYEQTWISPVFRATRPTILYGRCTAISGGLLERDQGEKMPYVKQKKAGNSLP